MIGRGLGLGLGGAVLIVDDDALGCARLGRSLAQAGLAPDWTTEADVALALLDQCPPEAALINAGSTTFDVPDFLRRARGIAPRTRLFALADDPSRALGRLVDAVLPRPFDAIGLARHLLEARQHEVANIELPADDGLVAEDPIMRALLETAGRTAATRSTIMILGETGVGKEQLAAWIHARSRCAAGPLIRVNCAALAESVIESELFGHERGSFTGAQTRRVGRFEQAHRGTLFLDEIGEISPAIQVKLLDALQDRAVFRVGGDTAIDVDVRIITATNRDLAAAMEDGLFREDLYYRLNVVRLEMPPLRARPKDIPILAMQFLQRFAAAERRAVRGFTEAALAALAGYPWPGNVRELENAVQRAVVLATGSTIDVVDLPIAVCGGEQEPLRLMVPGLKLEDLERYTILKTLEALNGDTGEAGRVLGISRRKVQYRLRQWGMTGHGRTAT